MTHSIKTAPMPRGSIAATLVSALLCIAALMAMVPGTASATFSPNPLAYNGNCDRGEFCLAYLYDGRGPRFDSPGSDDKLTEHKLVPRLGDVTANDSTFSVWNRGTTRRGVLVYNGYLRYVSIGWDPGLLGCVRYGTTPTWKNLPSDVRNKISSYKWVSDAQCREARQL